MAPTARKRCATVADVPLVDQIARVCRRLPDARGKARLGWRLRRHMPHDADWDLRLSNGERYSLPSGSMMSWVVAFTGEYDAAPQRLLAESVRPGTLVLDIGASLGLWTVPLGRAAQAAGAQVWAVEPHPSNHPWLHRNVELNGLQATVMIHEIALGDRSGTVMMELDERGGGNAAVSTSAVLGATAVPIRRLDELTFPAPVSAMKLDVEGFELSVLRGARALLARDRPVIFGEFSPEWLAARGEDLSTCLDELEALGYRASTLASRRSRPWKSNDRFELRSLPSNVGAAGDLFLRVPAARSSDAP